MEAEWGEKLSFYLGERDTIMSLCEYFKRMKGISEEVYTILLDGKRLRVDWTMHQCKIVEGDTLYLRCRQAGD